MVHQPVYDGRGQLVVPEHRAPLAELDVGRHDHAPLLVAVAHDLEQQARPLDVERHVAELVQDEQVGPPQLLQHRLEGVRPVRLDEHEHELGGGEEAHGPAGLDARAAHRDRQMRLAPAGLAVEHEVLGGVDESEGHEVVGAVAVRERHLGEVVPLEGLDLGEGGLAVEPGALVALADRLLAGYELGGAPDLRRRRRGEELLYGLVGEEHLLGQGAEPLGVVSAADAHRYLPAGENASS